MCHAHFISTLDLPTTCVEEVGMLFTTAAIVAVVMVKLDAHFFQSKQGHLLPSLACEGLEAVTLSGGEDTDHRSKNHRQGAEFVREIPFFTWSKGVSEIICEANGEQKQQARVTFQTSTTCLVEYGIAFHLYFDNKVTANKRALR
ncbi:unnamed protein product [Heligmosomoides polygyrus]|uniref:Uncharacterized protein n=1 Tax=Heligmosomoides polygyrus TaxID=6339 RepID=A0A183FZ21_HELPZ|nr:unnamed protein product [Heligmosomoides polygyrus]